MLQEEILFENLVKKLNSFIENTDNNDVDKVLKAKK